MVAPHTTRSVQSGVSGGSAWEAAALASEGVLFSEIIPVESLASWKLLDLCQQGFIFLSMDEDEQIFLAVDGLVDYWSE